METALFHGRSVVSTLQEGHVDGIRETSTDETMMRALMKRGRASPDAWLEGRASERMRPLPAIGTRELLGI